MRGEHTGKPIQPGEELGRSPRARGAPYLGLYNTLPTRTIPACAGSTRALLDPGAPAGDDPRVRGEHTR